MTTRPKFFPLVKQAMHSYQEKWLSYSTLALVTIGLGGYLQWFLIKIIDFGYVKTLAPNLPKDTVIEFSVNTAIWSELLSGMVVGLVSGVLGLVLVAGTIKMLHTKTDKFKEGLIYAIKNIGRFILTALYVLWYTFGWLLILVIGLLIANFLTKFSEYGLTAIIGTELKIDPMQEKILAVVQDMTTGTGGIINTVLVVAGIILIFVVFYRSVKVTFSYYALADKAKIGVREAVKESVKIVEGKWKLVFFYILGMSMLLVVVMSVLNGAVIKLAAGSELRDRIGMGAQMVISAIFVPIMVSFQYHFYHKLKK